MQLQVAGASSKAGASRASKHFEKQEQAIDWARNASRNAKGELVIHHGDGTIKQKNSYDHDSNLANAVDGSGRIRTL